jgi:hypothetical protein
MAEQWYCGPISGARRGYFRFGPYRSRLALLPHVQYGDIIMARNANHQIVAFEFALGRDFNREVRNPYDLARYWRASVNSLTEVERCKGADIMLFNPKDPTQVYEAARKYRELAEMHPEWLWANYLLEASYYIEMMANLVYHDIAAPKVKVIPTTRRPFPKAAEPPSPEPPAAPVRRRPPPGFFDAPSTATPKPSRPWRHTP